MNQESSSPRSRFASIVVRLAGTWILAGAVAKLFLGTPKDLPALVLKLSPFGIDLTFHLVIGVELAMVCLTWILPGLAWPLVFALFAFFDFILVSQLLAGASSCGCFGATIHVSPWLMLSVDSALILGLLASRPWSSMRRTTGRGVPYFAAGLAVSFALPWLLIRAPQAVPGSAPSGYIVLDPPKWVNRPIYEIEDLTRWVDAEKLPTDGRVVLWRQGCEHCAAHLRLMAGRDEPSVPILLLQIRDDLKDSRAVDLMPDGPNVTHAEFPENQQVILQTPWELHVSGGVVTAALDGDQAKAIYEKGG
jgi:hypothetical protein